MLQAEPGTPLSRGGTQALIWGLHGPVQSPGVPRPGWRDGLASQLFW